MTSAGSEQRRLAAIMFTDMVGYSALVEHNEALALELLEEHRRLLRSLFPRFNGTEVKTIGDAFLVEFGSALEAAQCGIEIQRRLAQRNLSAPAERQIQVRIGIHIGDVIHREGDVLGDGVNIASRIEQLAGPSGICISMDVERQIRHALEASLVKLPAAELKNIAVPMDLFRIVLPWEKAESPKAGTPRAAEVSPPRRASRLAKTTVALLAVLIVAGLSWWLVQQRESRRPSKVGPSRIRSLAVKPLDDYSGDTNQAYLSDGMTESLCAALGNISALRVPGRSSVMRYKGGQKTIQEMARELNVDAIVEGSVQRAGNRILVNVQLIEAPTDRHVWSANFKRDLSDFFEVQSEVARAIAAEVQVRLTPEDQARLARARTAKPQTVEAYLRGMQQWWQWSEEGTANALRYFGKAVEIEPNYAPAYAGLALTHIAGTWAARMRPRDAVPKGKATAQKAIQLDPMLADAYVALGYAELTFDWDWPTAERDFKRALELSPNSTLALDGYCNLFVARGRFEEAIDVMNNALELDPLSPGLESDLGWAYYNAGQFDRGIPHCLKALELDRSFFQAHLVLGWSYLFTGKSAEALAEFKAALQLAPDSPAPQEALGYFYGVMGRREEALQVLARLDQLAKTRYIPRNVQASVYLGLGQKELALDWLEKACDEHDAEVAFLKVDPEFAPLRSEPRFQALLKKVGLDQ